MTASGKRNSAGRPNLFVVLPANRISLILGIAAVLTLATVIALGLIEGDRGRRFGFGWLLNGWYVLTVSLGAIFFVALQHITRAGWSVSIRRVAEYLGAAIVVPAMLLVPIVVALLCGYTEIFPWNDAEVVARDPLLQGKQIWLNARFFAVRSVIYAATWLGAGIWFLKISLRQDRTREKHLTLRMEQRSAPVLLAMGLTISFASFDWLMSLDPAWFSTIFGVYVFSGARVGALAAVTLVAAIRIHIGSASIPITREHLHDVSKLLFGFNCFWAYIAFSQYLLIWYANIPEETVWLKHRQTGDWSLLAMLLVAGHFLIPFVVLMPRAAKRSPKVAGGISVLLLVMHWLDLYWLVYPQFSRSVSIGPMEISGAVFFVCCSALGALTLARGRLAVPAGDPRLHESVAHAVH